MSTMNSHVRRFRMCPRITGLLLLDGRTIGRRRRGAEGQRIPNPLSHPGPGRRKPLPTVCQHRRDVAVLAACRRSELVTTPDGAAPRVPDGYRFRRPADPATKMLATCFSKLLR